MAKRAEKAMAISDVRSDIPSADRDPYFARRVAAFFVAAFAFLIGCYLGSFQAGAISSVWDPIFGTGSEKVLLSGPALALRTIILIPDAGMGAIAYLGAAAFAAAGPRRRVQFRPWLVLIFGANVVALGFASTVLVLIQAFVVGDFCFLCLVTAACSYTLVLLASGEVWAAVKNIFSAWSGGGASAMWNALLGVPPAAKEDAAES